VSGDQGQDIGVIYGQYRRDIAAHYDIDPGDVTGYHVEMYENEKEQGQ
jgi:hypothetical protein